MINRSLYAKILCFHFLLSSLYWLHAAWNVCIRRVLAYRRCTFAFAKLCVLSVCVRTRFSKCVRSLPIDLPYYSLHYWFRHHCVYFRGQFSLPFFSSVALAAIITSVWAVSAYIHFMFFFLSSFFFSFFHCQAFGFLFSFTACYSGSVLKHEQCGSFRTRNIVTFQNEEALKYCHIVYFIDTLLI